ncbi:ATP-binding protein [Embleya sp. NPDC059237]|uniref:ATP-binding protein n=1 Tax=Embleya sp. NPDC059237 TaxID=3346784 RepID=UPI0036BC4502
MRTAREHAAAGARIAGVDADDVAQVVGELATNAFVHGNPTSPVVVSTHIADGVFWVTVFARQAPVELPPSVEDPDAESGRGLLITRALTTTFRCERRRGGYQAFVAGFAMPR